jgi:hypothetical protein
MRPSEPYKRIWVFEIAVWVLGIFGAVLAGLAMAPLSLERQPIIHSNCFDKESPSSITRRERSSNGLGGAARVKGQAAYIRLPLAFEPNQGQAPRDVKFLSRSHDAIVLLTATDAIIRWPDFEVGPTTTRHISSDRKSIQQNPHFSGLRMHLVGSNPAPKASGESPLTSKSNYLKGEDPGKWITQLPNYSRVRFQDVYPGIALTYYGNRQQLEYDFVIQPDAQPNRIEMDFAELDGASQQPEISLDDNGNLLLRTASGEIQQPKPLAYQIVHGRRVKVLCDYLLTPRHTVKVAPCDYDPTLPLIIDPVINYSVVGIGGSAITVDSQGNAYVTGIANPVFLPSTGAFQTSPGGGTCFNGPNIVPCPDILVAKLNPSGTELVYSTFLGGSGSDYSYGIAVDGAGNTYVTGSTNSKDFATTPSAYQTQHSGEICGQASLGIPCNNAFVTKLNSDGTALVYSTYLQGTKGGRVGNGIAILPSGEAFVTGDREDGGFVAELESSGSKLIFSVSGVGGSAIAVGGKGDAYVTGRKGTDSFVTKLSGQSDHIDYSFRLGGTFIPYSAPPEEVEALTGIALDKSGSVYVTGYTAYQDFPTTSGAAFPKAPGAGPCGNSLCRDAFVSKLNSSGTALVYSTYLGGSSVDYANGIAIDSTGSAYVTGVTRSNDFPVTSGTALPKGGGIFISKLNAAGTGLEYSITLGDINSSDSGNSIALDSLKNVFVTGNASTFATTSGAYTPAVGGNDSFVVKIFDGLTLFVPIVISANGLNNSSFTSELTVTNRSNQDVTLEFTYHAAFGGGSGQATSKLQAGHQEIYPDAISYLRSIGIPIPDSGSRGGTLAVKFNDLTSANEGAVSVRTTTAVNNGRVGLAYSGVSAGFSSPVYLCGLRHNAFDRTNVAIQNAGKATDGDIVLRLSVYPPTPDPQAPYVLPEETLAPGDFKQVSGILQSNGLNLESGYVRVERTRGNAPFYAYAVINDQANSDGSFVPPVEENLMAGRNGLTLPVVVETQDFTTELNLTNFSKTDKTLLLSYAPEGLEPPGSTANLAIMMKAQSQMIIPNFVQWMRQIGVVSLLPLKGSNSGPLFVTVRGNEASGIFVGGRTSSVGGGGYYGVFYAAVPFGMATTSETWIYGLQQNLENRSSLGLVNTGEINQEPSLFQIDVYDGKSGKVAVTINSISVGSKKLFQIGSILRIYAPQLTHGYLHIKKLKGANPFIAFSVINDGGTPGQRTGDGAFMTSSP